MGMWNPVIEGCLGIAYEQTGQRGAVQKALNQMVELSKHAPVPSYYIGVFYMFNGDKDKAFDYFEKAYEEKDRWMVFLKIEPSLDDHRSDPRYIALIKKMGLE